MDVAKGLAMAAEKIAVKGALEYLKAKNLEADSAALAECLKSWIKAKLPEALNDAKAALAIPGMEKIAEASFAASMFQAGIEAAKEAGYPKGWMKVEGGES